MTLFLAYLHCVVLVITNPLSFYFRTFDVCNIYSSAAFTNPLQNYKFIFDEPPDIYIGILYFANFRLQTFPDLTHALTKFYNLNGLFIEGSGIETVLRGELAAFEQITMLKLGENRISHLDAYTFADLKNLQDLYLNNNKLTEVREDLLKQLRKLSIIDLHSNQITSLPSFFFRNNRQLETIDLAGNRLKELNRDTFAALFILSYLDLSDNKLEILTKDHFRNNRQLIRLLLKNNRITEIDFDFPKFPELSVLYLSGNVCVDKDITLPNGTLAEDVLRNCSSSKVRTV